MIDFSHREIVLIDDYDFTHSYWNIKAKPVGLKVHSFFNPSEFVEQSNKFSKDALIYIDATLAENKRGEIEAKKIFDLGFENIWLVTGEPESIVGHFPWLKAICDKTPPWVTHEVS